MKKLIISFILILSANVAHAQLPGSIVSYNLDTFAPGVNTTTGTPLQTTVITVPNFMCGQTAPTITGTVTNPTKAVIDDPGSAGKVCIAALVANYLVALPNGTGYVATIQAVDNLGQVSARSVASNPFGKQGLPVSPTNLKLVP